MTHDRLDIPTSLALFAISASSLMTRSRLPKRPTS